MELILNYAKNGQRVLNITGIRAEEGASSNQRGALEMLAFDDTLGCDVYHPFYKRPLAEVWDIHRKFLSFERVRALVNNDPCMSAKNKKYLCAKIDHNQIPRNPLYDMGAARVGCFPCINSRKLEIRAMSKYRPERIDFIESQENGMINRNNFSSFFARKTATKPFRSKIVLTATGEKIAVATIRDIVKWSKTKKNQPWQFELELDFSDQPSACELRGYCE